MTAPKTGLMLVVFIALAAGCGGTSGNTAATTASTDTPATSTRANASTLKASVRTAIAANLKLSIYVLWNNEIPNWGTRSTRGPALKALRDAAATRRQQGIQIKNLSGRQRVVSITLAPSYATATAVIRDHRKVAPYKSGHRLGRAIVGDEHSRLELHRLGNTKRFVVWRVSPIQ